jgi:hypothetical protein
MGVKGEGVWAMMGSLETIIKGVSTSIWSKPFRLYLLVFWNTIKFMGEIHVATLALGLQPKQKGLQGHMPREV